MTIMIVLIATLIAVMCVSVVSIATDVAAIKQELRDIRLEIRQKEKNK